MTKVGSVCASNRKGQAVRARQALVRYIADQGYSPETVKLQFLFSSTDANQKEKTYPDACPSNVTLNLFYSTMTIMLCNIHAKYALASKRVAFLGENLIFYADTLETANCTKNSLFPFKSNGTPLLGKKLLPEKNFCLENLNNSRIGRMK